MHIMLIDSYKIVGTYGFIDLNLNGILEYLGTSWF